jgi:hypothetical protein
LRKYVWRLGLALAAFVYLFGWYAPAVDRAYVHYVRPHVTASIRACFDSLNVPEGHLAIPPNCQATWTLDGVEHSGTVLRKNAGNEGDVIAAAIVDDDSIYEDRGLSATDETALGGAAALVVLIPLAMMLRQRLAAGRGRQLPMRTALIPPVVALGAVLLTTGLVLYAVTPEYEAAQASRGALVVALGTLLLLAGAMVRWPKPHRINADRAGRPAAPRAVAAPPAVAAPQALAGGARLVPPSSPPVWWNDRNQMTLDLWDALRLATSDLRPGDALTTGRLLASIARIDVRGDWQRIWLLVGAPEHTNLPTMPDPAAPVSAPAVGGEPWSGRPLTDRLAQALRLGDRVATAYGMKPVPPGVVALALIGDRNNGATQALMSLHGATHAQLLHAIQVDILNTTLANLGKYIPAAVRS